MLQKKFILKVKQANVDEYLQLVSVNFSDSGTLNVSLKQEKDTSHESGN